jgi:hypothetical protein
MSASKGEVTTFSTVFGLYRADDIKASLNAAGLMNVVVHAPYTPQFGTMHTKVAF